MIDGIHHPGRPEDLRPAPMLWAHGALSACVAAAAPDRAWHLFRSDAEGMLMDPEDGSWWRLAWLDGTRAVLTGSEDLGSRCLESRGEVDKLAGAPDWLPAARFRDLLDRTSNGSWEPSFLYWWDGASWGRTVYPDSVPDDGLCVVGDSTGTPEGLLELWPGSPSPAAARPVLAAAAAGALEPAALAAFLGSSGVPDPAPALAVADAYGLTPGSRRPALAAGRPRRADPRTLDIGQPLCLIWSEKLNTGMPPDGSSAMSARIHFTEPGDGLLLDTVDGVHTEKAGAEHTGGAYELFEVALRQGPPMPSRRTPWAKTFYLLDGEMTVEADGRTFRLTPGASLTLPADVAHTFTADAPGTRVLGFATGDSAGRLFRAIVAAVAEHPDDPVPALLSVAREHDVAFV